MRASTALSVKPSAEAAAAEVTEVVFGAMGGAPVDLALLFLGSSLVPQAASVAQAVRRRFPKALLVGVTGLSVIGGGREAEGEPGLSLLAMSLPDVSLVPLHFEAGAHPGPLADAWEWQRFLALDRDDPKGFLLYGDPFSCDIEGLLRGLDRTWPKAPKVGGLASGGRGPGLHALFLGQKLLRGGAVGVAFRGPLTVEPMVAQGCRSLGPALRVTRCEANRAIELDGRPSFEQFTELLAQATAHDRESVSRAPLVGLAVGGAGSEPPPPDGAWLIRNILGVERRLGALAIGAPIREGQWVRFHVRDPVAADQDLRGLLRRREGRTPFAGVMHQCLGRGMQLYGQRDHDLRAIRDALGPIPLAGFFCSGEIGPVGGSTWLHGYSEAVALFCESS